MSTLTVRRTDEDRCAVPLLETGDRMTQAEFHRRYLEYPGHEKFELIGGIVFMSSPVRRRHGLYSSELNLAFGLYRSATPGVEVAENATAILGEESEPQPDLALSIITEYGGQTRVTEDDYIVGAAELFAEIAYSSRSIDLYLKRHDYQKAGVLEYLVLCIEEQELHWFHFPSGRPIKPNRQGVYRSRVFPGLWIDGPALLARNSSRLAACVQEGLASREHAAFVKRLQAARRKNAAK